MLKCVLHVTYSGVEDRKKYRLNTFFSEDFGRTTKTIRDQSNGTDYKMWLTHNDYTIYYFNNFSKHLSFHSIFLRLCKYLWIALIRIQIA